jgi:hypothetical protein
MAGTLVITTLSDGTNSTSATNCIQGSAKAWVNFDGATGTRRASYNVSSVTRNSTGLYTVNFTNAFADTSYATNVSANRSASSVDGYGSLMGAGTYTTTAVQVYSAFASSATAQDAPIVCVSCFR